MVNTGKLARRMAQALALGGILFLAVQIDGGQGKAAGGSYKVLPPATQDNLTIYPIVTGSSPDTHFFLTLDEGIRSGQVVVTEQGGSPGLIRPHPRRPDQVRPMPLPFPERGPNRGAEVNQLVLINNSDRPLILLAGEIVMGGKQDRVVGKDRIIPAKSDPIDLSVFCVEPHRWEETSARFGRTVSAMAQPSVRHQAMAAKDQRAVWNEVAKSRVTMAGMVPMAARTLEATSSYAVAMENSAVRQRVNEVVLPIERSYEKLMGELRAQKAVGAVVAVNGEIVWADVFASPALLEKYWPKLIRSYAAEAITSRVPRIKPVVEASTREAQAFLDDFRARRESVESEPGVYRNTEMVGRDFSAFILTSLLPGTGFDVHIAKMRE